MPSCQSPIFTASQSTLGFVQEICAGAGAGVDIVQVLCRWRLGIVKCRCSAGGQRWILCYAGE